MKDQRHMRIKEIVTDQEVETQEDLARALDQSGFPVTQATVSRDIKELQLIKVIGHSGRYKYAIPMTAPEVSVDALRRRLAEVFVSLRRANNLLVLKVMPGNAQSIAFVVDNMRIPELLGTIAGDDTLLLICSDEDAARSLETWLG